MNIALIIVVVYMLLLLFVAWASTTFQRNKSAERFCSPKRSSPGRLSAL